MAFGQPSGPPAGARDVARLAELVERAGFASFKEARHPLGLTQRQAAGRFTRDEAAALAERLEAELDGDGPPPAPEAPPPGRRPAPRPPSDRQQQRRLASVDDAVLARELELRGWTCIPPT